MSNDFYLRYYVGHKGKFGHEFLEFEFRPDGKLRYRKHKRASQFSLMFPWLFSDMPTTATTRMTQ